MGRARWAAGRLVAGVGAAGVAAAGVAAADAPQGSPPQGWPPLAWAPQAWPPLMRHRVSDRACKHETHTRTGAHGRIGQGSVLGGRRPESPPHQPTSTLPPCLPLACVRAGGWDRLVRCRDDSGADHRAPGKNDGDQHHPPCPHLQAHGRTPRPGSPSSRAGQGRITATEGGNFNVHSITRASVASMDRWSDRTAIASDPSPPCSRDQKLGGRQGCASSRPVRLGPVWIGGPGHRRRGGRGAPRTAVSEESTSLAGATGRRT
jgi:hypothetical protein